MSEKVYEEMDEKTTRLVMIEWAANEPLYHQAHEQATQAAKSFFSIVTQLEAAGDTGQMRDGFFELWNQIFADALQDEKALAAQYAAERKKGAELIKQVLG